ncbi:MAG: threonylcarbamoyl-AMP synthase, partial [Candidatus Electrothrix sp. AR5]|nr:threonylcarbamoyl-AMP synthase [Candidatus Electrothrix sp. AR5]
RVPESPICLAVIEAFGNPLLNTSAIRDDHDEQVIDAFDVEKLFGNDVDLIIDGGEVYPNPSTVISLISEQPEILREGKGDIAPFL